MRIWSKLRVVAPYLKAVPMKNAIYPLLDTIYTTIFSHFRVTQRCKKSDFL